MIRVFTAILVLACASPQTLESRQNTVVVFETEKGTIEMEVDGARAPVTAANFLKYVDAGFYDGGSVNRCGPPGQHRAARRRDPGHSVPDRLGAAPRAVSADSAGAHQRHGTEARRRRDLDGAQRARHGDGLVLHRHRRSTGNELRRPSKSPTARVSPRSAASIRGMDVVKAIQASPTGAQRDRMGPESLEPPIKILKAYRRKAGA